MNIDELKNKIDASLDKLILNGWSLGETLWVSFKQKKCCPLGALMLDTLGEDNYDIEDSKSNMSKIGLLPFEGYSFADGFDGRPYNNNANFLYWKLGKQYRNRLTSHFTPR